ncbi:hypothetical protein J2W55_001906 [Mucilaginibacter pocheonensis]|uniref:Uncharacterized protein n=1 Tax=Mucilaginibacter pocheonensis TaxID=398050 RepID=A0ABU1T9S7_9SPHI|nr:hypothetical protein [Mucilaginibacter pocheonensis]
MLSGNILQGAQIPDVFVCNIKEQNLACNFLILFKKFNLRDVNKPKPSV